jgi:hypothetical protein
VKKSGVVISMFIKIAFPLLLMRGRRGVSFLKTFSMKIMGADSGYCGECDGFSIIGIG